MTGLVRFLVAAGVTLSANVAIVYFLSRVNLISTERRQEELLRVDFTRLPPTLPTLPPRPAPPPRSEPRDEPEPTEELAPVEIPTLSLDFDASSSQTPGTGGESAYLDLALPDAPSLGPAVMVHTRIAIGEQAADPSAAAVGGPRAEDFRVLEQLDEPLRPRGVNADPRYPPSALRRRLEGAVTLEMLIDERGEVVETKVTAGSEPFVEYVLDAVRAWTFTKPRHRGQPTKVWAVKTFRFEIPAREERP